ncbi:MAG: hypothetical protein WC810_01130 [Janthinobacterium sp.]|jgi:hypothetical protein
MTTTTTSSTAAPLGATIPTFPLGEAEKAKLTPWTLQLAEKSGFEIWHNNSGLAIVKDNDFLADDCTAKDVERWFDGYQQRKHEQEESVAMTATAVELPHVDKARGEYYGGLVIKPDGMPEHHLIVLGDDTSSALTWWNALNWADERGGELPTMKEMSLVFAHSYEQRADVVYWSADKDPEDADYVRCLNMMTGRQLHAPAAVSVMAFAVRRVAIQEVAAHGSAA